MREIKFRAWNPFKQKMMIAYPLESWFSACAEYQTNPYDKEPDIIMLQFTGLTDKNGKEVYEGDILQWRNYRGVVEYKQGVCQFMIHDEPSSQYPERGWRLIDKHNEIIGNLYENPELIK